MLERFGYRYFKIAYQPVGLDHAYDVGRYLGSPRHATVVFDLRANEGQTAQNYVRAFPSAQIHSFEPVAATYQSLVPRVRTFQSAFADRNRTARRLDSFCAEQNIKRIDLLKTNAEGFDLEVLKGIKGDYGRMTECRGPVASTH